MSIPKPTFGFVARPGIDYLGPGAQFSRASGASAFSAVGDLEQVLDDILRHDYDPATGLYLGKRIEPERVNVLHDSNDFSDESGWSGTASFDKTEVTSIFSFSGKTAWMVKNDGGASSRNVRQTSLGSLSSGPESISVILENVDAASSRIAIRDSDEGEFVCLVRLDWSDGSVSSTSSNAGTLVEVSSKLLAETGPSGGKVYRLHATATPDNPGNTRQFYLYPTGIVTNTDTVIIHHAQHEEAAFASSPIITDGSPATRSTDLLTFDLDALEAAGLLNRTRGALYHRGRLQFDPDADTGDEVRRFPFGAHVSQFGVEVAGTGTLRARAPDGSAVASLSGLNDLRDRLVTMIYYWDAEANVYGISCDGQSAEETGSIDAPDHSTLTGGQTAENREGASATEALLYLPAPMNQSIRDSLTQA